MKRILFGAAFVLICVLVALGLTLFSSGSTRQTIVSNAGASTTGGTTSSSETVPKLVGSPIQGDAVNHARADGNIQYNVVYEPTTYAPPGMVVQESPPQGTPVAPGTTVTLHVSSGFPPGYTPPSVP